MLHNKRLSYRCPGSDSSILKKGQKHCVLTRYQPPTLLRHCKSLSDLNIDNDTKKIFLGNAPIDAQKARQLCPFIEAALSDRWGSHKHSSDPTGLFEGFFSLKTISELRQIDTTNLKHYFDHYGIVDGPSILTIIHTLQQAPTPDPEADVEILYNGLFGTDETTQSPLIASYNPIIDQLFLMTLDTLATCPNNKYQQTKGLAMLDNCWKGFSKGTNSQLYSDSLFKLLTYVQDHQNKKALFFDFIVTLQHGLKRIPEPSERDTMKNAFSAYIDTLQYLQQKALYKYYLTT